MLFAATGCPVPRPPDAPTVPTLYSAVQFRVGAIKARPDHESSAASCMLQRCSFGSRPLKAEASSLMRSMVNPVVMTPKLVCVESCR